MRLSCPPQCSLVLAVAAAMMLILLLLLLLPAEWEILVVLVLKIPEAAGRLATTAPPGAKEEEDKKEKCFLRMQKKDEWPCIEAAPWTSRGGLDGVNCSHNKAILLDQIDTMIKRVALR